VKNTIDFLRLFRNSAIALGVGGLLVTLCYFFVDRAVAEAVHNTELNLAAYLKPLTYPPPIVQAWAPAILGFLIVCRAFGPWRRREWTIVVALISLIVADQFRESLSFCFGRYWPETWIDNNPSWIRDRAYGFHPFESGSAYGSFPSGHMARTVAFFAVFWIAYPTFRWLYVLASLAVAVGLIGMNYHFVGDVTGGAFVGGIVGGYGAWLGGGSAPDTQKSRDIPLTE
jgi:membrane-associated phospholipid phosphatase